MDMPQNLTLAFVSSTLDPLSSTTSNLSTPLPSVVPFLGLHPPLPAIIIAACLFIVFGGCTVVLAVCRCSGTSGGFDRRSDDGHYWGQGLSSEPQLKLWKRLGSTRRSFSSVPSFRRPPLQRRPESKLALQLAQDRSELQAQLTLPCLLQYATEI